MARSDAAFASLHTRLFALYGDEAVLRGTEPTNAIITNGVDIVGEYATEARSVTTADLPAAAAAKVGDALAVRRDPLSDVWVYYIVDDKLSDDGSSAKFVVRLQ
ncbi:MAG TPA: hypothetical protein PLI17_09060 [Denitromonas sp.]|nr:hypothetical protein [Denitromonas sp.]